MGMKAILRGGQQSLAKEITTNFINDFQAISVTDLLSGSVSSTTADTTRGRRWNFVRGSWGLVSSRLKPSNATDYPITVIDALVPDVELNLSDIGQGAGAALWYTDVGNWWGIGTYQESQDCNCTSYTYSCNCTPYTYGYGCNSNTLCTNSYDQFDGTYYCQTTTQYRISNTYVFNYCDAYGVINYNYVYGYTNTGCINYTQGSNSSYVVDSQSTTCTPNYSAVCNGWSTSTSCSGYATGYSCETCTGQTCQTCYPAYIRVLQSIANTVTTLATYAIASAAKSLKISTLNKQISVQPYSDTSLATAIGTELQFDASAASETTKFGLMVSPSQYDEQMAVAQINIKRRR